MKDAIVRDEFISALALSINHVGHAIAWATGIAPDADEQGNKYTITEQRRFLGQELFKARDLIGLLLADLGSAAGNPPIYPQDEAEEKKEPEKH